MALTSVDLIVEDGDGLPDANAYIDLTYADEYHRLLDNELWASATENDKVASIIRATAYIDQRFMFKGFAWNPTDEAVDPDPPTGPQALLWPRDNVYDRNGEDTSGTVVVEIEKATAEYALRVLGDGSSKVELQPDPELDDPFRDVTMKREKVGPLEEETRYDGNAPIRKVQPYPFADEIVYNSGYVKSTSQMTVR